MTRLTRFIAVAVAAVMVAALGPLARASADEIPAHPSSLKACQNLRAGTFNNMLLNGRFTLEVYRGTVEINHSVPINGPRPDVYLSHSWLQMDYRANQPVGDATYLAFYCNGDLALRHENGSLIWHSNTAGRGGPGCRCRVAATSPSTRLQARSCGSPAQARARWPRTRCCAATHASSPSRTF